MKRKAWTPSQQEVAARNAKIEALRAAAPPQPASQQLLQHLAAAINARRKG